MNIFAGICERWNIKLVVFLILLSAEISIFDDVLVLFLADVIRPDMALPVRTTKNIVVKIRRIDNLPAYRVYYPGLSGFNIKYWSISVNMFYIFKRIKFPDVFFL